jgi:hypothetical protein
MGAAQQDGVNRTVSSQVSDEGAPPAGLSYSQDSVYARIFSYLKCNPLPETVRETAKQYITLRGLVATKVVDFARTTDSEKKSLLEDSRALPVLEQPQVLYLIDKLAGADFKSVSNDLDAWINLRKSNSSYEKIGLAMQKLYNLRSEQEFVGNLYRSAQLELIENFSKPKGKNSSDPCILFEERLNSALKNLLLANSNTGVSIK